MTPRWAWCWRVAMTTNWCSPPLPRPAKRRNSLTPVTRIGRIEKQPGLRLLDARGQLMDRRDESFDHFK